jgi:hypothetical protein
MSSNDLAITNVLRVHARSGCVHVKLILENRDRSIRQEDLCAAGVAFEIVLRQTHTDGLVLQIYQWISQLKYTRFIHGRFQAVVKLDSTAIIETGAQLWVIVMKLDYECPETMFSTSRDTDVIGKLKWRLTYKKSRQCR